MFKWMFKKLNTDNIGQLQGDALSAWKFFAKTPGGQNFLDYLIAVYCVPSSIDKNSVEMTYANIANKELVESLIRAVNDNTTENIDE